MPTLAVFQIDWCLNQSIILL